MKTLLFSLLLFGLGELLYAQNTNCINDNTQQACCNDIICTDPRTGQAINTERVTKLNKFNWLSSGLTVYHPAASGGYTQGGGPMTIPNPFFTESEYLQHLNFHDLDFNQRVLNNLDILPENGWELVHKNNGFKADEQTYLDVADQKPGPHFILYNRYLGRLRVLAALSDLGTQDIIQTRLSLIKNTGANIVPSGLFGLASDIAQPLDQFTTINSYSSTSPFPMFGQFFATDFKTAYDPCQCHNRSTMKVDFIAVDEIEDIHLEGRSLGTSVPLDASGNDPLLNGRDFLTSVNDPDFTIKNGELTYKNVDALVEKWKSPPELTTIEKLALETFGVVLKLGLKQVDGFLGTVLNEIGKANTPLYQQITGDTNQWKPGEGAKIASNLSDQIMGMITPKKPSIPNISFVESEMIMSGKAKNRTVLNGADFQFAVPGAKDNYDPNVVPDEKYPSYNETMGVFALIETPKLTQTVRTKLEDYLIREDGQATIHDRKVMSWVDIQLTDPLKYVFNPAAEVDYDKTNIKVAIVNHTGISSTFYANEVTSVNWIKTYDYNGKTVLTTPFYPIGCLTKAKFRLYLNQGLWYYDVQQGIDNFTLTPLIGKYHVKIMLDIVFKKNKYGKVNRVFQTLSYPVNINLVNQEVSVTPSQLISDLDNIPFTIDIAQDTYYPVSKVVQAWNTIAINANITVAPGATVTFRAGTGVAVLDQSIFNNPQIKIEIGEPAICDYVPQQTPELVKSFCTGSTYKANQFPPGFEPEGEYSEGTIENDNPTKGISNYENRLGDAIPNPSSDNCHIPYEVAQSCPVQMTLFNSVGDNVGDIILSNHHGKGKFDAVLNVSQIPSGVYFYRLNIGSFTQTKKLIIVH